MFGFALRNSAQSTSRLVSADRLEGTALFEAVVCGLHDIAARIAAVTSAINAVNKGRPSHILLSSRFFVPREPALLSVVRAFPGRREPEHLAGYYYSVIFREMEGARMLFEKLTNSVELKSGHRAVQQQCSECAERWKALSLTTLDAINKLEPETRWRLMGLYSENSLVLARALRQSSQGGEPCVDDQGLVALPVLPQRRMAPRFTLLQNCTVICHRSEFRALAIDISAGGMGLSGAPTIGLKETVQITLKTGRRFKGMIVWQKSGKLGVRFNQPLLPNDPLISE